MRYLQADYRRICFSSSRLPASPGFTLLEVLVACGILVFALSGIAAMLPAASARLADAAVMDRAGAVAANAYAEVVSRRVVTAQRFTDALVTIPRTSLAFGGPLKKALDSAAETAAGKILTNSIKTYDMKEFWPVSDARSFASEDDLQFGDGITGLLSSLYESTDPSGFPTGPRRFRSGVNWGAFLMPNTLSSAATPGMRATLALMVFRKQPEARVMTLTSTAAAGPKRGLYTLNSVTGDTTTLSTFARPCSYVLALPPTMNDRPPKWLQVNSSWTRVRDPIEIPKVIVPFVMFANEPTDIAAYESGGVLTVIGFSGLLRVDEYPVVLQ